MDQVLCVNSEVLNHYKWEDRRFFQSQRGLRQGDPMSPFLFLLAMEGLNYMVRKANELEWIRGFGSYTNRAKNMEVTHLLYADDSLMFCGVEVSQEELCVLG